MTAKARFKKYCRLCDSYMDKLQIESLILVNIDVMETLTFVQHDLAGRKGVKNRSVSAKRLKSDDYKKNKLQSELKSVQKELECLADTIKRESIVSDLLKPLNRSKEELAVLFKTLSFVKTLLDVATYTENEILELCDIHYQRIKKEV